MAVEKTNAQEREALYKIREILEGFDPEETYVGKAFEGCVELADENLCSDQMMSYKGRYDNVSEQLHAANVRIIELTKTLNQKDDTIARYAGVVQGKDREISRLNGVINNKDETYKDLEDKLEAEKAQSLYLKQRIFELKAKLYDMITAGEEVEE